MALTAQAEQLVKEQIQGHRKGMPDEPNYLHSYRVRDLVSDHHHWDDPNFDLFLGALLHDVVEDGEITLDHLRYMGFPSRTIELVDLCSHDLTIQDPTSRWILMIGRLVAAQNEEAWIIKLADLTDNLTQCQGLSKENRRFMIEVKAPLMLRLTKAMPFDRCLQMNIRALEEEMERQQSILSSVQRSCEMDDYTMDSLIRGVQSIN